MEPVISPWVFYLISVAGKLQDIAIGLMLVSGMCCIACVMFGSIERDKDVLNKWKLCSAVFIFGVLLGIFSPNQDTIYKILIAQNITHDRVEKIASGAKNIKADLKQDIIDILTTIKKEEK